MKKADAQLGTPQALYKGTQAAIEALTGVPEGAVAYATDTNKFGSYDGTTWTWGQGVGAVALADLTDVNLTGLAEGDMLYWQPDDAEWQLISITFFATAFSVNALQTIVNSIPNFYARINHSHPQQIQESNVLEAQVFS